MNPESRPNSSSSENKETQKKKPSIDNEPQNKESHKMNALHNKEASDAEIVDGKKQKVKKSRKLVPLSSNISILNFTVVDIVLVSTTQPSHTNPPITPTISQIPEKDVSVTHAFSQGSEKNVPATPSPKNPHIDENAFITYDELFKDSPANKELSLSQILKNTSPVASANPSHLIFPSPISSTSHPNLPQDKSTIPTTSTTPPSLSLLDSLLLNKKGLDSVKLATQTLSHVINSAQSLTDDPSKLRSCSVLSQLLRGFHVDKASRDEVLSQIDPSFHVTLDVLKNISLEKEIQRLRGELQISNFEAENLR
ncbi:uncharacterized protein LOC113338284 [Papaver somniferum]|uniref:uncharacterized protein LOC113338284 n=1 Tax=Papaver somniferum TaxID=3469 RepID=UPI000E6FDF57|nr:uncharacterized protein LOC113338284 [Papaver somniferum]